MALPKITLEWSKAVLKKSPAKAGLFYLIGGRGLFN